MSDQAKEVSVEAQSVDIDLIKDALSPEDKAIVNFEPAKSVRGEQLTDADVVDFGGFNQVTSVDSPEAVENAAGVGDADESPSEDKTPADDKKVFKVGKRSFPSAEAMAEYIEDIDRKQAAQDAYNKGVLDAVTPVELAPVEVDPADIIFEDPKKAVELIKAQMRQELKAERQAQKAIDDNNAANTKTWQKFYVENPDLVGWNDTVDLQLQKLVAEGHSKTSIDEGLKLVATRSRAELTKYRQRLVAKEEVPSGIAVTSGVTGAHVPKKVAEPKVTSFIEETKALRRGAVR